MRAIVIGAGRGRRLMPTTGAAFAVELVNQVVDSVNGIKVAVHLCRRAGHT